MLRQQPGPGWLLPELGDAVRMGTRCHVSGVEDQSARRKFTNRAHPNPSTSPDKLMLLQANTRENSVVRCILSNLFSFTSLYFVNLNVGLGLPHTEYMWQPFFPVTSVPYTLCSCTSEHAISSVFLADLTLPYLECLGLPILEYMCLLCLYFVCIL